ncbi:MAG TPA: TolC family protein [Woeseiaceae bacterium]|nr:TolC family protein [Woeseiaceae bacterium]
MDAFYGVTLRHRLAVIALMLAALARPGPAAEPGIAEAEQLAELTLPQALQIAIDGNPGLAEMTARAQAAEELPSQVGTLPDPKINLNALNLPVDSFSRSQEAMTQMQLGVSQSFPFPGKLRLRREMASYEAQAASLSVVEARLRLLRDVKKAWWELVYLDRAIAIIENNVVLIDQFIDIANTKYSVGRGLQQDVLLGQVERGRLHDRILQLQGMRGIVVARLNALLARPRDEWIRLPAQIDETLPALPGPELFLEESMQQRPLLTATASRVKAAEANRDLAEKSYYPDFTLAASYGLREGQNPDGSQRDDFVSVMLSVDVPLYWWRKQTPQSRQRSAELIGWNHTLVDTRNLVEAEIQAAWYAYRQAQEQSVLFGSGIIPQSRQTVESMRAGYQVNKVDFLNLVQSQISLYNFEQQYWRALTQARQALAELAAASGREYIDEN